MQGREDQSIQGELHRVVTTVDQQQPVAAAGELVVDAEARQPLGLLDELELPGWQW